MKRPNLETAANLAILIVAGLVGVSYIPRQQASRATPPTIAAGDTMPAIQNIDFKKTEQSVVLVAKESCPYCEVSMPFYKSLAAAALAKRAQGQLQIVFLTTDSVESATRYLAASGVDVDQIIALTPDELAKLNIQGTPTLLLVNRDRTVKQVWVGRLNSDRERGALLALGLT